MACFGVHVGSSSVCLAVCKEGKTGVVTNDAGERVTPAIVAFTEDEKLVGVAANQQLVRSGANVVVRNKHFMGKGKADVQPEDLGKGHPCKLVPLDDSVEYEVAFQGKQARFNTQDIATLLYRKMHETACSYSHSQSGETLQAVITVPPSFMEKERRQVKAAAELAGFQVLQVVSEPVAAVLAYGVGQGDVEQDCTCLVYRAGGTSVDATLVHVRGGMYFVEGYERDEGSGGQLATTDLASYLSEEFYRRTRLRPEEESMRSVRRLRAAAEEGKRVLSTGSSAQCLVESLCQGADLAATASRARFDNLVATLLPRFLAPVTRLLEKTGASVDKVILAGGATKTPRLQQALVEKFPSAVVMSSIPPDEVIATGAAYQAGLVTDPWDHGDEFKLTADIQVVPMELAFATDDSCDLQCIVPTGSPIPAKRTMKVPVGDTGDVVVHVYEVGSNERKLLADLEMKELGEKPQVNLTCHVRLDGTVHLALTNQASGRVISVDVDGEEE